MAEMIGGAFLSSAFQVLFDRLASSDFVNYFRKRKHGDGDNLLWKLKIQLLGLNAVLDDAEKQQVTNKPVKEWLDELKDTVYHADDLLDEIATKALKFKVEAEYQSSSNQVRAPHSTSSYISSDVELVSRIEEILDRLQHFTKSIDFLGLKVGGTPEKNRSLPDRLPSTCLVDQSIVFGRDIDKEEIIKQLFLDEASGNKIDVIPIVGMGGVGKTTLAQLVYNDVRVSEHFKTQVWVSVSEYFDVLGITKTILEAVTSSNHETRDLNVLQLKLKESLTGKKFLVVLDDVWNENRSRWDLLMAPFVYGACRSKIIATTRSCTVASIMQTVPVHVLKVLSDEDCWLLFDKIAFSMGNSEVHSNLKKIGKEIVTKRCKGLPLAAKTLAGLLRSKLDFEEWENVLNSDIWDLPEDNILPVLRLSYFYLPSQLKQCFAFCSIFPKDYDFNKYTLVLTWVAHNLVQHPKGNKTLEKSAGEYFEELVSRSFFQKSSGKKFGFVMHDLVHDLAQVVSGQFSSTLDATKQQEVSPKVRHFSYVRSWFDGYEKFEFINEVKCLRTFLSLNPLDDSGYDFMLAEKVLHDLLSTKPCLRVLSLSRYEIKEVPNSIGKLIHLRLLDLSETKIKQLPEIVCTLYNLQTLLLFNCGSLTALPAEIGKLICLRHLDISGTKLSEMPAHMGQFKGLQNLTGFVVGNCSRSAGIDELKDLNNLHGTLTISRLGNVKSGIDAMEAKLEKKKHLEELVLEWAGSDHTRNSENEREVLERLKPRTNLKSLVIRNYEGTRFPKWMGHGSYSNMVSVKLENCEYCFCLPPLGQLSALKRLTIARMNGIREVGPEFYGDDGSLTRPFESLETLCFEKMPNWVKWHDVSRAGEFSQLKELKVINCPQLVGSLPKDIPSWVMLEIRECPRLVVSSLANSSKAQELVVSGCDGVELGWPGLASLVKLEISGMPDLTELTPELRTLTNLKELNVGFCPKLLSLPNSLLPLMLARLEIWNCEGLQHSVLEGSPMCCRLEYLEIRFCSSLVSLATDHGLPTTLKEIDILWCPRLVLFPLPPPLSGENLTERSCPDLLERLNLVGCHSLRSLPLGLFPEPQRLTIRDCTNFETLSIPEGGRGRGGLIQILSSMKYVNISGCPNMVSFPRGGLPAPSLTCLEVVDCERLEALPERMHTRLPTLRSLYISSCPEIESFPEGGLPSSLDSLQIRNCEKLVAGRREWGLQSLPSLTRFSLGGDRAAQVKSFPEEGLLPSSLTHLLIQDMPNLKSLNGTGLQLLTSLEDLIVSGFPQLKSMNGIGFRLLSSLQRLEIRNCPQLHSLPEEGLSSSLCQLRIQKCPLVEARCHRNRGEDWHKIAHIPFIEIDYEDIEEISR